jgi:hypothetical protein
MLYKLKKPDLSKVKDKRIAELLENKDLLKLAKKTMNPDYLYWDKIKYQFKPDLPKDVSAEEFWALVKIVRKFFAEQTATPIRNEDGQYFIFIKFSRFEEFLHEIDLNMGGSLSVNSGDDREKRKYQLLRLQRIRGMGPAHKDG